MNALNLNEFKKGQVIDFGITVLSEKEIIDFATAFDPLDFHMSIEAGKKSYFKNLIASGPHIFNLVHRTQWIPRFGKTVICGLEVNNWKFLKPVFPNMSVFSKVTVTEIKANNEKKQAVVKWLYEFKSQNDEMITTLESVILHKIE